MNYRYDSMERTIHTLRTQRAMLLWLVLILTLACLGLFAEASLTCS